MSLSKKQIEAILALPAPKRYSHFIKKVVGWKKAWGLYNDGWAMTETPDGKPSFPLWPEKDYAELCIDNEWSEYVPREIELEDLLENLIPSLRENNTLPGVFFIQGKGSTNATLEELEKDLRAELVHYT